MANAIDAGDLANRHTFQITDRLTVTFGASGHEHFTIPVHDAAMVGSGLPTWSHDSLWLSPSSGGPGVNTAFVRFDWANAFRTNTGVTNGAAITVASLMLEPGFGDSQTMQLRRCLQRWSDPPAGGDFNGNPTGAPTWNSSAHGSSAWNQVGAGRLAGNGTATNEYFGTNDLAARVDATAVMTAINEPLEITGALVTDAFRFWFQYPAFDNGYALRLASGSNQETRFERWEDGFRDAGPVLKITYLLPGAAPRLGVQTVGSNVRVSWPIEYGSYTLESTPSLPGGWSPHPTPSSTNATTRFIDLNPSGPARFFRLATP